MHKAAGARARTPRCKHCRHLPEVRHQLCLHPAWSAKWDRWRNWWCVGCGTTARWLGVQAVDHGRQRRNHGLRPRQENVACINPVQLRCWHCQPHSVWRCSKSLYASSSEARRQDTEQQASRQPAAAPAPAAEPAPAATPVASSDAATAEHRSYAGPAWQSYVLRGHSLREMKHK